MSDLEATHCRRIATEEAFSIPEVDEELRTWSAAAPADEPDQAVRFMNEADIPDEYRRKIFHRNAERIFGIAPDPPNTAAIS
jgi:hypothetical protein